MNTRYSSISVSATGKLFNKILAITSVLFQVIALLVLDNHCTASKFIYFVCIKSILTLLARRLLLLARTPLLMLLHFSCKYERLHCEGVQKLLLLHQSLKLSVDVELRSFWSSRIFILSKCTRQVDLGAATRVTERCKGTMVHYFLMYSKPIKC